MTSQSGIAMTNARGWRGIVGCMTLLGCLVWCGGCVSGSGRSEVVFEAAPWKFAKQDGKRLTTTEYEIFTTVKDENLQQALPRAMQRAYDHYRELIPSARPPAGKMPVFIFARRGEFEAFTRRRFEQRADLLLRVRSGGYCEDGVTVIEYVSHGSTFPVLTHEGFHQFLHHCVPGAVPAWLNEGLATLCEGQRWSSQGITEFDEAYNPIRRNLLADALLADQTIPLEKLLTINAGNVIGGPTREVSAYYSQLWTLLRFIREDRRYRDGYRRMADALAAGELMAHAQAAAIGGEEAIAFGPGVFRAFIAPDIAAFEPDYVAYMRRVALNQP